MGSNPKDVGEFTGQVIHHGRPDIGPGTTFYGLLERVRKRPGMYLGQKSLDRFRPWLDGYFMARFDLGIARTPEEEEFDLFGDFVCEYHDWRDVGGWSAKIAYDQRDDAQALDEFFRLFDLFREARRAAGPPGTPAPAPGPAAVPVMEVIAEHRLIACFPDGGMAPVVVLVGRPYPHPRGGYACPVQAEGLRGWQGPSDIFGAGTGDALALGLRSLRAALEAGARRGTVSRRDGDGPVVSVEDLFALGPIEPPPPPEG